MLIKNSLIIRRAKYKDKETLRYMIRKTDQYHYDNCPLFAKDVDINPVAHRKESDTLIDRVDVKDFYIMELYSNPIGTIMVWDNNGETTLINFFIEEEYRGRGYGRLLLDRIIKDMKTSYCVLGVFEENKKSLEFYYRYGFYYIQTEETTSGNLLWLRFDK